MRLLSHFRAALRMRWNGLFQRIPMHEDETPYRSLVTAMVEGVVFQAANGKITELNPAAERILGRKRDEIIGLSSDNPPWPTIREDGTPFPGQQHPSMVTLGSGEPQRNVIMGICKPEGITWISINSQPIYNATPPMPGAGPDAVLTTFHDITANRNLAQQREQYLKFFALSVDAMAIADPFGCFLQVNPAMMRLTGYSRAELVSKPFLDFVFPDDRQKTTDEMKQQVAVRPSMNFENRYVCKDGRIILLSWTAYFDQNDGVTYATARDITELKRAEDMLRLANTVVESSATVLFRWRAAEGWPVEYVSENVRQFGYTAEELMSGVTPYEKLVHPDDLARVGAEVMQYSATGTAQFSQEYRIVTKDGAVRWIDDRTTVERNPAGSVLHYQGVVTDITDRKQAEDTRRTAALYARNLIEASLDPLVTISPEGKITDVNRMTEEVTGLERDALIGTDFANYFTEPEQASSGYREVLARGQVRDYPLTIRHRDGRTTDVLYNATVYRNGAGEVQGVFAAARDITERKRAEEERHAHFRFVESLDRINLALQASTDLDQVFSAVLDVVLSVFDCDRAWLIYPCDPGAAAWQVSMERTRQDFPGAFKAGVDIPADPGILGVFQTVRAMDGPATFGPESVHPLPEGTAQFGIQSMMATAVYPKMDRPYMFGLHQCAFARVWTPEEMRLLKEISRRLGDTLTGLLAYRNLRKSETHLRTLVQTIPDLVWLKDPEGIYLGCNSQFERFFGATEAEILGKTDYDFVSKELADFFREHDRKAMAAGEPSVNEEWLTFATNGYHGLFETTKTPMRDPSGKLIGILGIAHDITEREHARAALQRSESGLKEAQRITHLGNWELDLITNVLTWSDELYRIFEIDPAQFGTTYEAFLNSIHPQDRDAVDKAYTDSLKNRTPYEITHRLLMQDGRIKYVNEHCETTFDPAGKPLRSIGTTQDVTARRLDEIALKRANRALHTLSACNEALVRATNETELLNSICRLIVDKGGYRMAWVGYAEQDAEKTVRPVARYGHDEGFLEEANYSWSDTERGRNPTGTAIRTGSLQVNQNFLTNPAFAAWREAALRRGYQSSIALPLKTSSQALGVLTIDASEPDAFNDTEITLLQELASDLTFGIETLRMRVEHERVAYEHQHHEEILRKSLEQTIEAIADTVEARDPYTAGHQRRVSELAVAIAQEMGLPMDRIHGLLLAATIHDLGKIHVPAEILAKPGKLSDIEYMLIKTHPQFGYDILKDVDFPWPIAEIVFQHHEKLDGSGYPQGLKNNEILPEARILAVADVVEAMATHRPYRPALGIEAALKEIGRGRGKAYDAAVVDACTKLLAEERFTFSD